MAISGLFAPCEVMTLRARRLGRAEKSKPTDSEDASFAFLASPIVAAAVVYSAFIPGALANYIQLKGQAGVSASEAQVIYASTPAFNALVSVLALGETLTKSTIIGGAVILVASLASFFVDEEADEEVDKGS